jgi:uncharacterized membrane protein
MKANSLDFQKNAFLVVYTTLIYFYILRIVRPELHFHLQQPAFLNHSDFFQKYLNYPGGLAEYVGSFLSQFFYYNGLGSLIILCIGVLIAILHVAGLNKTGLGKVSFSVFFITLASYVALFNNYYFPFSTALKFLFTFFMFWIWMNFKTSTVRYTVWVAAGILTYYVAGSGCFMAYSILNMVYALLFGKVAQKIKHLALTLILAISVPYIAYHYIFGISPDKKYFGFFPEVSQVLTYNSNLFFYAFMLLLPTAMLFGPIIAKINSEKANVAPEKNRKAKGPAWQIVYTTSFVAAIMAVSYFLHLYTYDFHKKNIVLTDMFSYKGNWDEVINCALSDPEYDFFINCNYNRAVSHKEDYIDQFFNYPQLLGNNVLFPDQLYTNEIPFVSSDYYFDLGYISEAQHWAYEAMVYYPYSARAMQRLVETHLINGDFVVAGKYLDILEKGYVSKAFVDQYKPLIEDTTLVAKHSMIMEKRSLKPGHKVLPSKITLRFKDLLDANPENKLAYNNLQLYFILSHELKRFADNLGILHFYHPNVPHIFEQAYLVYLASGKETGQPLFNISEETVNQFIQFNQSIRPFKNNLGKIKNEVSKNFGNTVMFHLIFNSPLVTKAGMRLKAVDEPHY